MTDRLNEKNTEPIETPNMIGTVIIIAIAVIMITLGIVMVLALIGPSMGPGIYSNISHAL